MDQDRELARLIRESGLVPVERVRASLRRVGVSRTRRAGVGEFALLADLIQQGDLDAAGAARIREEFEAEQRGEAPSGEVREWPSRPLEPMPSEPEPEPEPQPEPQPAPQPSAGAPDATTTAKLPDPSAVARAKRSTKQLPDRELAARVGITLEELQQLKEQARILQQARIVSDDDLRRAYRAVLKRRQSGRQGDVLDILVRKKRILPAHAHAVRLKIYRDHGSIGAPPDFDRSQAPLASPPSSESPPPPPSPQASAPPAPAPAARVQLPHESTPDELPLPSSSTSASIPVPPPGNGPAAPPQFGAVALQSLLDDDDSEAGATPDASPIDASSSRASFVATPAAPPAGADTGSSSSSGGWDFSAVIKGSGEGGTDDWAESSGGKHRESSSKINLPAMLFTRSRDRALGLMLTESAVVKSWQLEEAQNKTAALTAEGRETNVAQQLVALGFASWDDLTPFLERLYGQDGAAVILPSFDERGTARDISQTRPASSSAGGIQIPVPLIDLPGRGAPGVAPFPGAVSIPPTSGRGGRAGEAPVAAPPPPPDGAKPVVLRDITPRTPEKKKKTPRPPRTPRERPQKAPENTLQVQEVPALPPHLGGIPTSRPVTISPDDAEPVGELGGRIGEDRFSVTGALGLAATVDLRDPHETERALEEEAQVAARELERPGTLLDDPQRLADDRSKYLRVDEIGRGGMSAVVRARDRDVRRDVAMKVLEEGHDRHKMSRFLEEAQITGQLEHPNIVPVHDVGLDRHGRLFFTMKLVHGESLAEIIEQTARRIEKGGAGDYKGFTQARLLEVFLRICNAVAFAHSRGVIHRDLKPENVMVGEYGEVLVMDWGVAKVLRKRDRSASSRRRRKVSSRQNAVSDRQSFGARAVLGDAPEPVVSDRSEDSALASQLGDITGTPSYMPPEQARGDVDKLDERSDVYSLGAVLYELLTLEAPFEGDSIFVILKDVLDKEPLPPSRRAPGRGIALELDAIVMRAMAKDPAARYPTVSELAADVQAWLDGGRVASVEYTSAQLLGRWARQKRTLFAGTAMLFIVIMIVWAVTGSMLMSEQAAANAARAKAESALADAQQELDDVGDRARKLVQRLDESNAARDAVARDRDQALERERNLALVVAAEWITDGRAADAMQRLADLGDDARTRLLRANAARLEEGAGLALPSANAECVAHSDLPMTARVSRVARRLTIEIITLSPDGRAVAGTAAGAIPATDEGDPQAVFVSGREELLVRCGTRVTRVTPDGERLAIAGSFTVDAAAIGPLMVPGDRWNCAFVVDRTLTLRRLDTDNETPHALSFAPVSVLSMPDVPGTLQLLADDGTCVTWRPRGATVETETWTGMVPALADPDRTVKLFATPPTGDDRWTISDGLAESGGVITGSGNRATPLLAFGTDSAGTTQVMITARGDHLLATVVHPDGASALHSLPIQRLPRAVRSIATLANGRLLQATTDENVHILDLRALADAAK